MGIDQNIEIAYMKSLTEYCERKIAIEYSKNKTNSFKWSDGFAAFPSLLQNAKNTARNNALNEAIERYLWSNWWDDDHIIYELTENFETKDTKTLIESFSIRKLLKVEVKPINSDTFLTILIAVTKENGYITGGAAGTSKDESETYNRALGELIRHLMTLQKIQEKKTRDLSRYEKRLYGFGAGNWSKRVEKRLSSKGIKRLFLPSLLEDREIEHTNQDVVIVHHCLFEGQPDFMGGAIERLCF